MPLGGAGPSTDCLPMSFRGWRGDEARKVIGSLIVGAGAIYYGVCEGLGQKPNLDPRSGKFMTVKIGDTYVGFGTPYVALLRLGGNIYKQIDQNPAGFVTFEEGTDQALINSFAVVSLLSLGLMGRDRGSNLCW